MSLAIHLLGRPHVERDGEHVPPPRGRKAWALLAYLALSRVRAPSREHLAELLFATADDPLGSLRWNLAELRRLLGPAALARGEVRLVLPPDVFLDVHALIQATPQEAVAIPGLGSELLEGMDFGAAPAFETWLLGERRRLLGASESALHEAALDSVAIGEASAAVPFATRLVGLNPYDENFQELLIRAYAEAGDREAAHRQLAACVELFRAELDQDPGAAVFRAAEAAPPPPLPTTTSRQGARARLETGRSAVNAGSVDAGARSLGRAAAEAMASEDPALEAEARLALGTALVHATRGRDQEGATALLRAAFLAERNALGDLAAAANRELAFIDILQARYSRCAPRLARAGEFADSDQERAGVEAMLGITAADTGAHERAFTHLRRSVALAEGAGSAQQASYSLSFVGRSHVLREEYDEAAIALEQSLAVARDARWIAFEPWPESWLAEVHLAAGDVDAARDGFEHAWALGCELGDPCWQGMAGQGLGRVALRDDDEPGGLRWLEEARRRAALFPDGYVWGEGYVLATLASIGVDVGHRRAPEWVADLTSMSGRTGIRELGVTAALLRAALGDRRSLDAAKVLVAEVENPALHGRVDALREAALV
jgi:DNA-binding SARP family transcriptional activator